MIFDLFICFCATFILTILLLRNTRDDKEPPFFKNMVLVINTDTCNNQCIHVHHWEWMLLLLVLFILSNYLLGYKWNKIYNYLISLYLGTFFGELILFKNNIFLFQVPCFNNCNITSNK
jgi:hypothetical protein